MRVLFQEADSFVCGDAKMKTMVNKTLLAIAATLALVALSTNSAEAFWGHGRVATAYYAPAAVPVVAASPVVVASPVVTAGYAPVVTNYAPVVTNYAPVVTNYAPSVTYSAPATTAYYAPAAAPVTTYYAPTVTAAPAMTTYYAPAPVTTLYAPATAGVIVQRPVIVGPIGARRWIW